MAVYGFASNRVCLGLRWGLTFCGGWGRLADVPILRVLTCMPPKILTVRKTRKITLETTCLLGVWLGLGRSRKV